MSASQPTALIWGCRSITSCWSATRAFRPRASTIAACYGWRASICRTLNGSGRTIGACRYWSHYGTGWWPSTVRPRARRNWYKAHLRTLKIEGLRGVLAQGGPAEKALFKHVDLIKQRQTIEGLTLIDAKDEFQAHPYVFSGLSDMLIQFGQQLAG